MKYDVDIFKKISSVEDSTGYSLKQVLDKVSFSTVITAFSVVPLTDIVDMVKSVSIDKLICGLSIITLDELENISVDKLKTVLKFGNMDTIEYVNRICGSRSVIIAIDKMNVDQIKDLLIEDNRDFLVSVINKYSFVNK